MATLDVMKPVLGEQIGRKIAVIARRYRLLDGSGPACRPGAGLCVAAIHDLAGLSGHGLSYIVWEDPRIELLTVASCSVGAVGLVLRKSWARWLALALAARGIGSSGLNIMLGAIVMSLAGPALLILAGLTAWFAYSQGPADHLNIAGYYACFWVPAGVISTIAGASLARPVWRLWHELADRA